MSAGFGSPPDEADSAVATSMSAANAARVVLPFCRAELPGRKPPVRVSSVSETDLAGDIARDLPTAPTTDPSCESAQILPFLLSHRCQLSIGIDDFHGLRLQFSESCCQALSNRVHALLLTEFSARAATRHGNLFRVKGKNFQVLIAGILRVQFHVAQLPLPERTLFGEAVTRQGLHLVWGIGDNAAAADLERKQKSLRQSLRRFGSAASLTASRSPVSR